MNQLYKEQVAEIFKENRMVKTQKKALEKDFELISIEHQKAIKELDILISSSKDNDAISKLIKEKKILERQLKKIKEILEITREKLTITEKYCIGVEEKYKRLGGDQNILIRPHVFAAE